MGCKLVHHAAILEVMPHRDYLSSVTSSITLPNSQRQSLLEMRAKPFSYVCQNGYLQRGRHSQQHWSPWQVSELKHKTGECFCRLNFIVHRV